MKIKILDNWIIDRHQRYNVNSSFFDRVLIKFTKEYYKVLFVEHSDRSKISKCLWGRKGGFAHAKVQFNRSKDEWLKTYDNFYNTFFSHINKGDRMIEIGCSMGQWVKRLTLYEKEITYLGIDINPMSIESAQKIFSEYNNIEFRCVDLNNGFNFNNFNLIICVQVLFFLDVELIKKMFYNLKKRTKIILTEPINFGQENISEQLNSKNSVGFSHDYIKIFESLGFDIDRSSIVEKDGGKHVEKRITMVVIKR
jgi:SAM-dependent methyltransferase